MCFLCEHPGQWEDPDFGLGRLVRVPACGRGSYTCACPCSSSQAWGGSCKTGRLDVCLVNIDCSHSPSDRDCRVGDDCVVPCNTDCGAYDGLHRPARLLGRDEFTVLNRPHSPSRLSMLPKCLSTETSFRWISSVLVILFSWKSLFICSTCAACEAGTARAPPHRDRRAPGERRNLEAEGVGDGGRCRGAALGHEELLLLRQHARCSLDHLLTAQP